MARKIRLIGIATIFAIIIGAMFSIFVIQANTINDVESVRVKTSDSSSVELRWHEVSSADGYFVYASAQGKDDFKKILNHKGNSLVTVADVVKELKPATSYDFYVTAYKSHNDKIIESENHEIVTAVTNPSKEKIKLTTPEANALKISWSKHKNADGYELQYIQTDKAVEEDFEDIDVIDIAGSNKTVKNLKKLEAETKYFARVRSYKLVEEEKLYGEWSDIKSATIEAEVVASSDIDPNKPMVALTFDDGPGYNKASDKILDVLEKYNVKATFFMVGQNAADHPANVKRKVDLGCEIGNHTYNHSKYGNNISPSDISKASKAIETAGGKFPTAFRSPGGVTTDSIRSECKKEGMVLYYWSLDTQDWKNRNADTVYNRVMNNVEDGDIILMHEIYDSTADAVAKMVPDLLEKGYQLVTCEELVAMKTGEKPKVGQQYLNATTIKNNT